MRQTSTNLPTLKRINIPIEDFEDDENENKYFEFMNDVISRSDFKYISSFPSLGLYKLYRDGSLYVAKVMEGIWLYSRELQGYNLLHSARQTRKYVGNIYLSHFEDNLGIIVTDYLGESLKDMKELPRNTNDKIKEIITDLYEASIYHSDLHLGNITYNNGKYYLIDYADILPMGDKYKMKFTELIN